MIEDLILVIVQYQKCFCKKDSLGKIKWYINNGPATLTLSEIVTKLVSKNAKVFSFIYLRLNSLTEQRKKNVILLYSNNKTSCSQ